MSDHVKEILTEIGYTLRDCGREYRTKPLYRDSDNPNVLCIKKTNGVWIDFKTNKCGNLEELVKLTLNLKDLKEAKVPRHRSIYVTCISYLSIIQVLC